MVEVKRNTGHVFIKTSRIRRYLREQGVGCRRQFFDVLDRAVKDALDDAADMAKKNGTRRVASNGEALGRRHFVASKMFPGLRYTKFIVPKGR